MKNAFLFPGQGAQHVGMGRDLYGAAAAGKEYFDRAEAATGLPIKRLCSEGPEEELSRTDIAQPAIFTVAAALLAHMQNYLPPEQWQRVRPLYLAGLSLGEYTAVYAAGCMDFETGVRLVARRGELMQQAATAVPSGMVAVMGLDEAKAWELCRAAAEGQVLTCANFNAPGQIVLSGEAAACDRAVRLAEQFGASGAVVLKVAGAFHSEIMKPAAEKLSEAIDDIRFKDPRLCVVSNVDGKLYRGVSEIKGKLLAQLVSPVRWQQCIELLLAEGTEGCYEVGPGRVLAGLMRRIDCNTRVTCVNSLEAVEKLVE